ncbi:hypothetical protein TYRP_008543 [Tyrophagus putrescentiae]|nr:hypothetical protein TYRP_008543 [Tyrophagus putrescentiae]
MASASFAAAAAIPPPPSLRLSLPLNSNRLNRCCNKDSGRCRW